MPVDRTLRAMLARWAADTDRVLDYRHPYDFTLHAPAARISATRAEDAVAQVIAAFATARVLVTADERSFVVKPAPADGASAVPRPAPPTIGK